MSIEQISGTPYQVNDYDPRAWNAQSPDLIDMLKAHFGTEHTHSYLETIFTRKDIIAELVVDPTRNGLLGGAGYAFTENNRDLAIVFAVIHTRNQAPALALRLVRRIEERLRERGCTRMQLSVDAEAAETIIGHYLGQDPSMQVMRFLPGSRRREFIIGIPPRAQHPIPTQR